MGKETDHLFETKQKYMSRAYKSKLKEIEEQRRIDRIQSKHEKTIDDEQGMDGFFNQYLNDKTQKRMTMHRSRSRSRSRDRDKEKERKSKVMQESEETPDEEQRYH